MPSETRREHSKASHWHCFQTTPTRPSSAPAAHTPGEGPLLSCHGSLCASCYSNCSPFPTAPPRSPQNQGEPGGAELNGGSPALPRRVGQPVWPPRASRLLSCFFAGLRQRTFARQK